MHDALKGGVDQILVFLHKVLVLRVWSESRLALRFGLSTDVMQAVSDVKIEKDVQDFIKVTCVAQFHVMRALTVNCLL